MPAHLIRCPRAVLGPQLGANAFRATLPNGHELTAVVPKAAEPWRGALVEGVAVELELSPANFAQARIVALVPDESRN